MESCGNRIKAAAYRAPRGDADGRDRLIDGRRRAPAQSEAADPCGEDAFAGGCLWNHMVLPVAVVVLPGLGEQVEQVDAAPAFRVGVDDTPYGPGGVGVLDLAPQAGFAHLQVEPQWAARVAQGVGDQFADQELGRVGQVPQTPSPSCPVTRRRPWRTEVSSRGRGQEASQSVARPRGASKGRTGASVRDESLVPGEPRGEWGLPPRLLLLFLSAAKPGDESPARGRGEADGLEGHGIG